jgi:hypothetical protein
MKTAICCPRNETNRGRFQNGAIQWNEVNRRHRSHGRMPEVSRAVSEACTDRSGEKTAEFRCTVSAFPVSGSLWLHFLSRSL